MLTHVTINNSNVPSSLSDDTRRRIGFRGDSSFVIVSHLADTDTSFSIFNELLVVIYLSGESGPAAGMVLTLSCGTVRKEKITLL